MHYLEKEKTVTQKENIAQEEGVVQVENILQEEGNVQVSDEITPVAAGGPAGEVVQEVAQKKGSRLNRSMLGFFTTMRGPLMNINFSLLFSGQTISTLGDAFYLVALPWIVLNGGGNPQVLGIVLAFYGIPRLATAFLGGFLSDVLRPRWVMLIADVARAVVVAILALIVMKGNFSLVTITILVACLGAFAGLFIPASYSIIPDILPKKQLQAANAINSSALQLATLVGYGVAGIVVARLLPGTALMVDAATFVVSAITLIAMRSQPKAVKKPAEAASTSTTPKVVADAERMPFGKFLLTSRVFQITLLIIAVTYLASGGTLGVALPSYAHSFLAVGANGYGVMLAVFAIGELVGALSAGGLGHLPRRPILILFLQIGEGVTFAALALCGNLPAALVVLAFAGILNGLINVMYLSIIQELFPRYLMGRIWGVIMFATYGVYPLSVALGGVITDRMGPQFIFIASGVILTVAAVIGLVQPALRELP
jgi:MFS family permease